MTVLRLVVAYLVVPYLIAFALALWVLGMFPWFRFGRRFAVGALWQFHSESTDDIETWLNDHTPDECKSCGRPCKYNELYGGTLHDDGTEECGEPYGDNVCDPQSYVWHWHDGEFFLSPICDNEEECNDDTCAHNC